MKYKYYLIGLVTLCICISYVSFRKVETDVAKVEDTAAINQLNNNSGNKTGINEESLADKEQNLSATGKSSQEPTKILSDNSKLNVMYDGIGNKTESRCFETHPRMVCVVLKSGVNGQRQAVVYGHNGDVRYLPEDKLETAMTASGDEIANLAGLTKSKHQTSQLAYTQPAPVSNIPTPLRPAGDIQPSIQNIPVEPVRTDNAEKSEQIITNSENKSTLETKEISPKESDKLPVQTPKPDERK